MKAGYYDFYGQVLEDSDLDKMFEHINHSGTGAISYSEFVVAAMFERNLLDNAKLLGAFNMFDKDGDGFISVENFRSVLSFFREETDDNDEVDDYVLNRIIKEVDTDGDDQISYEDFQAMMFKTVAVANPPETVVEPVVAAADDEASTQKKPQKGHHRRQTTLAEVKNAAPYMDVFVQAYQAATEESVNVVASDGKPPLGGTKIPASGAPLKHRRMRSHLPGMLGPGGFAARKSRRFGSGNGTMTSRGPSHRKNVASMPYVSVPPEKK